MPQIPSSEVRGLWFTTARRYVLDRGGETWLEAMADRVGPAYRAAIVSPDPNAWYPERALQQSLAALHYVVAGGDDEAFVDVIEECTLLGINLFFRMMLRLATPAMLLRRAPTMWNHIRRGAGLVEVEMSDRSAVLQYSDFPFFRDRHYRLLTIGAARALVTACGRPRPVVEVQEHHFDRMTVRVIFA